MEGSTVEGYKPCPNILLFDLLHCYKNSFTLLEIIIGQEKIHGRSVQLFCFSLDSLSGGSKTGSFSVYLFGSLSEGRKSGSFLFLSSILFLEGSKTGSFTDSLFDSLSKGSLSSISFRRKLNKKLFCFSLQFSLRRK